MAKETAQWTREPLIQNGESLVYQSLLLGRCSPRMFQWPMELRSGLENLR